MCEQGTGTQTLELQLFRKNNCGPKYFDIEVFVENINIPTAPPQNLLAPQVRLVHPQETSELKYFDFFRVGSLEFATDIHH